MQRKDSDDPRWPGYVMLPIYMRYKTLSAWENALDRAKTVSELSTSKASSDFFLELLPIACSIVEEWHIEGLPEKVDIDNFPASTQLLTFVTGCVSDLYSSTNAPVSPKAPEQS